MRLNASFFVVCLLGIFYASISYAGCSQVDNFTLSCIEERHVYQYTYYDPWVLTGSLPVGTLYYCYYERHRNDYYTIVRDYKTYSREAVYFPPPNDHQIWFYTDWTLVNSDSEIIGGYWRTGESERARVGLVSSCPSSP